MGLQRLARIGFALGTLAIIVLSLLPADEVPSLGMWDKLEHALTYGTVAALGGVGWAGNAKIWARVGISLAVLGAVLELLQTFVPGRLGDVADAFANVFGTVVGMTAVAVLGRLASHAGRVGKGW